MLPIVVTTRAKAAGKRQPARPDSASRNPRTVMPINQPSPA